MGEAEPVEQLDMGEEDVDQGAVVIPTKERLCGFLIQKSKVTLGWQRFEVITDQRDLSVEPGNVGDAQFDAFCVDVKAMFLTEEGQIVLSKMRALVRSRPLQVATVVAEAPAAPAA